MMWVDNIEVNKYTYFVFFVRSGNQKLYKGVKIGEKPWHDYPAFTNRLTAAVG